MRVVSAIMVTAFIVGCQSDQVDPELDCSTYSLSIQSISSIDAQCGNSDGGLMIVATGGDGDYTYILNGNRQNNSGNFTSLPAGNYAVVLRDKSNCEVTTSANVANSEGVQVDDITLVDAGCDTNEGVLTITASGGVAPIEFALNDRAFQSSGTFMNLETGEYEVHIKDQENCEVVQHIYVPSGISFTDQVGGIIEANCALADCHGGTQPPDFRVFSNVQDYADQIKTRTGNGSMPPNTVLSSDDMAAIACWVDDGARDN